MTITVYPDVILDECVFLAGATGANTRINDRSVNQGGYATVNAVRDVTLRRFDFGVKPMLATAWREIEGVYEITDAGTYGFLIKDPKDHEASSGEGVLIGYMGGAESAAAGVGNGGPLYGLRKVYTAAGTTRNKVRPVTRLAGAITVTRGGTPVTVGGGLGQIAISGGPSYVTFQPDATQVCTGLTVGSTTQVALAAALPGLAAGDRLWLEGMTGTDAALLNNLAHEILSIAGTVYTINTNTAGKAINGVGVGRKYPQPTESLQWTGAFYVPVHFAEDTLDWSIERPGPDADDRLVAGPSCTLLEIREA